MDAQSTEQVDLQPEASTFKPPLPTATEAVLGSGWRTRSPQQTIAALLVPCSPTSTTHVAPPEPSPLPNLDKLNIVYPTLPDIPPRDRPLFHKGAQIALENVLDHYLCNPDMTLLEVIRDLEDKVPVIGGRRDDWERRCKLDGGLWVCGVVRRVWGDLCEEYGLLELENLVGKDDDDGDDEMESEESEDIQAADLDIDEGNEDGRRAVTKEDMRDHAGLEVHPHLTMTDQSESMDVNSPENDDTQNTDTDDVSDDDEKEHIRSGAEAQIVLCLVRLLKRWLDIQMEEASDPK